LEARFRVFVQNVEPRLHGIFFATYGHDRGREATAAALGHAWEFFERVEAMSNPVAYLYRVGQTGIRTKKVPVVYVRPENPEVNVEPGLIPALESLPERQRQAVMLVHGEGLTLREVAELLEISIPTVQKHAERGLASLRRALNVDRLEGTG